MKMTKSLLKQHDKDRNNHFFLKIIITLDEAQGQGYTCMTSPTISTRSKKRKPLPLTLQSTCGKLAWLYSACNNVAGDQIENNDCANTTDYGLVQFNGRFNSDRRVAYWPLPPDTYVACFSFDNNHLYEQFFCDEYLTFDVVE